jgi:hypothetical protein
MSKHDSPTDPTHPHLLELARKAPQQVLHHLHRRAEGGGHTEVSKVCDLLAQLGRDLITAFGHAEQRGRAQNAYAASEEVAHAVKDRDTLRVARAETAHDPQDRRMIPQWVGPAACLALGAVDAVYYANTMAQVLDVASPWSLAGVPALLIGFLLALAPWSAGRMLGHVLARIHHTGDAGTTLRRLGRAWTITAGAWTSIVLCGTWYLGLSRAQLADGGLGAAPIPPLFTAVVMTLLTLGAIVLEALSVAPHAEVSERIQRRTKAAFKRRDKLSGAAQGSLTAYRIAWQALADAVDDAEHALVGQVVAQATQTSWIAAYNELAMTDPTGPDMTAVRTRIHRARDVLSRYDEVALLRRLTTEEGHA